MSVSLRLALPRKRHATTTGRTGHGLDSFCRPSVPSHVLAHEDAKICRVPRRRSKHCSMFHHLDDSRKHLDDIGPGFGQAEPTPTSPYLRLMVPGSKTDNCFDADVFPLRGRQFLVGTNFFGGRERRLELPDFSALKKCRLPARIKSCVRSRWCQVCAFTS